MLTQVIDLNPVEPARLGFRHARGTPFSALFLFREQGVNANQVATAAALPASPQMIFLPHYDTGAWPYDLTVVDPTGGTARVEVPGSFFQDRSGYTVELYTRDADGHPTGLVARGTMKLTGGAYTYQGPLGPMTLPTGPIGLTGPPGAQGPVGAQGVRGGSWTTGTGNPTAPGGVDGDMYLNSSNGDVWRWSGGTWTRGSF